MSGSARCPRDAPLIGVQPRWLPLFSVLLAVLSSVTTFYSARSRLGALVRPRRTMGGAFDLLACASVGVALLPVHWDTRTIRISCPTRSFAEIEPPAPISPLAERDSMRAYGVCRRCPRRRGEITGLFARLRCPGSSGAAAARPPVGAACARCAPRSSRLRRLCVIAPSRGWPLNRSSAREDLGKPDEQPLSLPSVILTRRH